MLVRDFGRALRRALGAMLVAALAVLPGVADAQGSQPRAAGARVRLHLVEPRSAWRTGRLFDVTPDSLLLVSANGRERWTFENAEVARLQISRGWRSRAGTGAAIGAAAGAGAIVALSLGLAQDSGVETGKVVAASLFVAGAGAALGALIGSRFSSERWVDLPRPWGTLGPTRSPRGLEIRYARSW